MKASPPVVSVMFSPLVNPASGAAARSIINVGGTPCFTGGGHSRDFYHRGTSFLLGQIRSRLAADKDAEGRRREMYGEEEEKEIKEKQ